MDDGMPMGIPLENIAHIIQVALTPVFLLSGIAGLLNVVANRQARIADQFDATLLSLRTASGSGSRAQFLLLTGLRRRLGVLDLARALAALAGAATCGATVTLFLGAMQNTMVATALFLSFGGAVFCTLLALVGYLIEVAMSSRWRMPDLGEYGDP